MTRRQFLGAGAFGVGALAMPELVRMRAAAEPAAAEDDTAVILLWLPGGPPHMEMYDMKPDAPDEYRGEFRPIRTNVPGIDVCEHLPLHAKCRRQVRASSARSTTRSRDHGGGHKRFLTGRDPMQPTGFVNDYPMVGSMVVEAARGPERRPAQLHRRRGRRPAAGRHVLVRGGLPRPGHAPVHVCRRPGRRKFCVKNLEHPAAGPGRQAAPTASRC